MTYSEPLSSSTKTANQTYAELHCISNFTFLRGASYPEELVTQAKACLLYTSDAADE